MAETIFNAVAVNASKISGEVIASGHSIYEFLRDTDVSTGHHILNIQLATDNPNSGWVGVCYAYKPLANGDYAICYAFETGKVFVSRQLAPSATAITWEELAIKEPTKLNLSDTLSSISVVNNDAYRFGNMVVANIRFSTTATITANSTLFTLPAPINSNATASNSAVVNTMLKEPSDGTSYNATVIANGSVYCTVNIPNGRTLLFHACYIAK